MRTILAGLVIVGLIPLLTAWRANRTTSLVHAVHWGIAAWLTWGIALVFGNPNVPGMDPARYCALCLTACATVAVLGARRPFAAGWNFVVVGLFTVMVLPLVETLVIGTHPVDPLRIFFMTATVAVGMLNYLPTRFAPAAVFLMAGCLGEIALLFAPEWFPGAGEEMLLHGLILAFPWIGWICAWKRASERTLCDQLWLSFRDRWGLFWGQRARDQFNLAAQNAAWPVRLRWGGMVISAGKAPPTSEEEDRILQTLRAVLQRFVEPPQD